MTLRIFEAPPEEVGGPPEPHVVEELARRFLRRVRAVDPRDLRVARRIMNDFVRFVRLPPDPDEPRSA